MSMKYRLIATDTDPGASDKECALLSWVGFVEDDSARAVQTQYRTLYDPLPNSRIELGWCVATRSFGDRNCLGRHPFLI